jgi:hypothetical protein
MLNGRKQGESREKAGREQGESREKAGKELRTPEAFT